MSACTEPKVSASSYTPADSQVLTAIPFIAEFSLICSNGDQPSLYADIEGSLVPVTKAIEGNKYQVTDIALIRRYQPSLGEVLNFQWNSPLICF